MPRLSSLLRRAAMLVVPAAAAALGGCHHIDNHRLHVAYVNVTFLTQADWDFYGVSGAGQHKIFNVKDRVPANFPYTAMSATGVGGILLCTTYLTQPVAYDLACPVECRADVRVFINDDMKAECPRCHSLYDVFEGLGNPVGGPAAEQGYGLEVYRVGPGPQGECMMISK